MSEETPAAVAVGEAPEEGAGPELGLKAALSPPKVISLTSPGVSGTAADTEGEASEGFYGCRQECGHSPFQEDIV